MALVRAAAMPHEIRCPECGKPLRVADRVIGRPVQCPFCRAKFTAVPGIDEPPAAIARAEEPASATVEGVHEPPPEEEQYQLEPAARRPDPPLTLPTEEPEERPRRGQAAESRKPPAVRKRKHSYKWARSQVMAPAIGTMAAGGVTVLFSVLFLLGSCGGLARLPSNISSPLYGIVTAVIGICWDGILVVGGLRFLYLTSWGQSLTAGITACLPCNPCCLFSVPFGAWAIILLFNPDIREHYDLPDE